MGPNPVWLVSLKEETDTSNLKEKTEFGHREKTANYIYKVNNKDSGEPDTLILDVQNPELWEIKFLLFMPAREWCFVIAALANQYGSLCKLNTWC